MAAIFDWSGKPLAPGSIEAMTAAMDYRGPDGLAHWCGKGASLGACVMHTTAEAREAALPWSNEDGSLLLLLDGYVADYDGLRNRLRDLGARLRNRSDAELVLRAFEAWGDDCARHIEGEFAYVVWNARQETVHCARDHAGLRPLFYCRTGDRLVLASDFAALRAAGDMPLVPNERVLVQLAANRYHFRDETIWDGVKRVMPAHAMRFDRSGQQARQYWHLPEPCSIRHSSDADYAGHYRHVLCESIRQASRSGQPIAIEVSGGLDSTAVLGVARQLAGRGELAAPGIGAFALQGPRGTAADESAFTQAAEDHFGCRIHREPLHVPPFDWLLAQARRDADIPYYPNSAMAIGMYRDMARRGHRVALNGLGGDEWLNGNRLLFHESLAAGDWAMLRRSVMAMAQACGIARTSRALARFGLLPWLAGPLGRQIAARRRRSRQAEPANIPWLSPAGQRLLREEALRQPGDNRPWRRPCPLPMTLAILEQASRLRSQCGVEGRHPLFSRSFVEFSAATPEAIRLRGNQQKYVHRLALASLLPRQILERSTKAEFSTVFSSQLSEVKNFLQLQCYGSKSGLVAPEGLQTLFTAAADEDFDIPWQWPLWGTVALMTMTGSP